MGSNGLTSARHDILNSYYSSRFPESFDTGLSEAVVYTGSRRLTTPSEVDGIDIGKLILSPTRTYAPVANRIFDHHRKEIHGMVHCSGGGQTKILHFIDNLHIVKNNMLQVPPLFRLIQSESGTSWKEMYTVFNMGHRLEYYVPESIAPSIIEIASSFNIDAQVIGYIEPSPTKRLTIKSEFGEFEYDS
jgi:phosphoribosylformylglycinamidine cyclo-ligase